MKHTVPTLTALALMGAIPAFGASIADDLVIKPAAQLQLRAQIGAGGSGANGDDYNIYGGSTGLGTDTEQNDTARFSLRRARFGVSAKNSTGWDALFQIRAGERADAGTGATSNQPVTLYYANIGKTFKEDTVEQRLHIGLDKAFNGESSISSSTYMFPNDRAIANLIEYRAIGVGYTIKNEFIKAGVDVMNGGGWSNFSDAKAAPAATATVNGGFGPASQGVNNSSETKPGLFFSGRIEFAPGAEYMPAKKMESFAGAEGTHVVIGFDIQDDNKNLVAAAGNGGTAAKTIDQTTVILGPDVLVHWNSLSALIDYRVISVKQNVSAGATAAAPLDAADDVKGSAFGIQAGYAIPLDAGFVIEPAIRFHKVDLNKDLDEGAVTIYKNGEWQAGQVSGSEFDIGLNFYWNGNANKTQIEYSSWKGEDSAAAAPNDSAPDAHVISIQQQVTF